MKNSVKFFLAAGAAIIFSPQVYSQTPAATPQAITPPATENMVSLGENVKMKIGGFLRADMYFDTRKSEELVDGLFNFYPLGEQKDALGNDINDVAQFRMAATASRLNSKFMGPDVLNAKSSALVEFDFTGVNGYGLRLRHAWVKLNWEKSELLFGRFWHPLFILDAFPTVLALSTGAPFSVFNRCEQLRYTVTLGSISVFGAVSAQMKYGYPGANQYQPIPELSGNAQFKNDQFIFGVSGNLKTIQPNLSYISSSNTKVYKTDDKVTSWAALTYLQVKTGDLKIKGSILYGQNMYDVLMLGGYATESQDTLGKNKYATINNFNYWGNIVYGKDLQLSLFVGYLKNDGTNADSVLNIQARGSNIDRVLRIAPCVSYKTGRLLFQVELEHNIAAYGITNKKAQVTNTKDFSNTRLQIATTYMF